MMMLSQLCRSNDVHKLSTIARLFDLKFSYHSNAVQRLAQSRKKHFFRETNICRGMGCLLYPSRFFSSWQEAFKDKEVVPSFTEFVSQIPSRIQYKHAIMKRLNCTDAEAKKIQGHNFYHSIVPLETLMERINIFEELGVKFEDFQKNPSILFANFEKSHELLQTMCRELKSDGHSLLPLLELEEKTIELYLKRVPDELVFLTPYENRIKYFSKKLEIPERAVSEKLMKYPHLLKLPANRITGMMDILLDAGVDKKHIYYDLWVFKFNLQKAKERLSEAGQAGIKELKPWLARCAERTFQRTIRQRVAQQVFETGHWEEIVARMFDCTVQDIEKMVKCDKRISRLGLCKLQEATETLRKEGFSTNEILRNPRIFLQISTLTLKQRLEAMHKLGLEPKDIPCCLGILTKQHDKYYAYVETLAQRLPKVEKLDR